MDFTSQWSKGCQGSPEGKKLQLGMLRPRYRAKTFWDSFTIFIIMTTSTYIYLYIILKLLEMM